MLVCPNESTLLRYLCGSLNANLSNSIDAHLDHCDRCEVTASILELQLANHWKRSVSATSPITVYTEDGAALARQLVLDACKPTKDHFKSASQSQEWRRFLPGDRVDDFLILRTLGSGGLAQVYLAQQISMQRFVALKVTEQRTNEAPVLSKLDHPHIVRVFDERDLPDRRLRLLYMQHITGGSLKQALSRLQSIAIDRRMGRDYLAAIQDSCDTHTTPFAIHNQTIMTADWPSTVCWFGARLADALSYAHDAGVLHRDIKPGNILIASDGGPCLADFNLSYGNAIIGAQAEDCFGGTTDYMSPEQAGVWLNENDAIAVGPPSDVYSLGIVLFELLTGQLPFVRPDQSMNVTALQQRIQHQQSDEHIDVLHNSIKNRHLEEELQRVLAFSPDQRPSAAELTRFLQLNSSPSVRDVLYPGDHRWIATCRRWPITTILLFGLPPNIIISVVNTFWNLEFFFDDDAPAKASLQSWVPLMNVIVFLLGICVPIFYGRSFFAQLASFNKTDQHDVAVSPHAIERGITLPSFVGRLCLMLWFATGIAFPALIAHATGALAMDIVVNFFASQLLHGIIASSVTFLVVAILVTRILVPQVICKQPFPELNQCIDQLLRRAHVHFAILGMAPTLGVIFFAGFSMQSERLKHSPALFLSFCVFGAIGFSLALLIIPSLRSTIRILLTANEPTRQQLYGQASSNPR